MWWVALIGLTGLAMLLDTASNRRQAITVGWAAGTGYFALTLHWIVEPFLVDAARHAWMAPFALVALSAGLATFWGLAFGTARWLGGPRWSPLALVGTLTLAEILRSTILTGFPWGLLAYIWTDTAPMQIVSVLGPHGLTFLTLMITSGVFALSSLPTRSAVMASIGTLAIFFGLTLYTIPQEITDGAEPGPIVRVVQPNAPQHLKWQPEMMSVFFNRALELTSAPGNPDLIVWPETSVPALLGSADNRLAEMNAAASHTPIVAGIQRRGEYGYHNSMILIDGAGTVSQIYDKYHLVPFGEYIPFGALAARIGITAFAAQNGFGYAPGAGPKLLQLPGALGAALPLICYEAIFPQDVAAAPTRPGWLLQITNDAWFGEFAGPQQHLAQAQFRAVEQGLPLIRAANTGISAVIDGQGQIVASLSLGEAGYVDAMLPPALAATPYNRMGDVPIWCILLLCLASIVAMRHLNRD